MDSQFNHKITRFPTLFFLTALISLLSTLNLTAQRRLLVLSWNVESGGNDKHTIVKRLADFEGYDIYGLTEVRASNFQIYADAAAAGEGSKNSDDPDFQFVSGTTGGADRMMIIYDNKRFEKIGDAVELDNLNQGGHRAPLFCKFKFRGTDIEFIVMVNHLARGNENLRNTQATGLAEWAEDQTVPVIALGDYNFDYDIDEGVGNTGFENMKAGNHWTWLKPDRLYQTQLSPKFHSVLDFIYTAKMPNTWVGSSRILISHPSVDNDLESDHRPIEGHFYITE
ncbi:endonuclease/exonuclease/phosphatase family protein [Ekhidna sp.]|jgi:endonuclease/exonuclease/phosphatase family metal-dependent hydrolase|uniref:endonuclease/exonuclease/phosphatase family protein n=1 Tax=Ekhidna sp. TaxID=2608089 RepID=UPI0032F08F19